VPFGGCAALDPACARCDQAFIDGVFECEFGQVASVVAVRW
jgi:hypothetical protein